MSISLDSQTMQKQWARICTIGLLLVGVLYIWSGLEKLMHWQSTVDFVNSKGYPLAALLVAASVVCELLLPVALVVPRTRALAALGLCIYTFAAGAMFHDFWNGDDAAQSQLINFLKNLALSGAFIYIFVDALHRARSTGDYASSTLVNTGSRNQTRRTSGGPA